MKFNQRIRNRRLELKLSMKDIAEKVNISIATYSRYESGEIANVRKDKIKLLADALKTNPGYLMGWVDEACDSNPLTLEENEKNMVQKFRRLSFENQSVLEKYFTLSDKDIVNSVISMAFENESLSKGAEKSNVIDFMTEFSIEEAPVKYMQRGLSAAGSGVTGYDADYVAVKSFPKNADGMFEIRGDSMEPLIPDGSTVFIKSCSTLEHGEIGIFETENGTTCKRLYKQNGVVELRSENSKYAPIIPSKVRVVAKVILV